ncbi:MAG: hypothetical protein ACRDT4_09770 [Micromonosporaceae bacterium]
MTLPDDRRPSIAEVLDEYEREASIGNTRAAAELAYALAVRLQGAGRVREAAVYGKACLKLIESLPSESLDDVTSTRLSVGGVELPEYFHDGVVRTRLSHLLEE